MFLIPSGIILFPQPCSQYSVFCKDYEMLLQEYPEFCISAWSSKTSLLPEVITIYFSYLMKRRAVFWTHFKSTFWPFSMKKINSDATYKYMYHRGRKSICTKYIYYIHFIYYIYTIHYREFLTVWVISKPVSTNPLMPLQLPHFSTKIHCCLKKNSLVLSLDAYRYPL